MKWSSAAAVSKYFMTCTCYISKCISEILTESKSVESMGEKGDKCLGREGQMSVLAKTSIKY